MYGPGQFIFSVKAKLERPALQRELWRLSQILDPFTAVFSEIHAYLYVFLCVVGVFANIAIVVVLLRPAMRRSPFNLFLICIAICDATLMATYLLYKHVSP
ncbi:hypothetical protein ANCCEY_04520 [Ancylostoma ceylanicum]|uniref:G-protein coupled receptors family 1 profile domain-containing protein n=1 Tax=Ancylostoma ceylanicum TaxID=53326 RepID=A0A0D6LWI8_9BILA|nr:hypothetical protein ANCCEY_04520 [Ancylostoma ceylanicum]